MKARLLCSINGILWDLGCIYVWGKDSIVWLHSEGGNLHYACGIQGRSLLRYWFQVWKCNQFFFFLGLPLGFHARFQNTKEGLAPLV